MVEVDKVGRWKSEVQFQEFGHSCPNFGEAKKKRKFRFQKIKKNPEKEKIKKKISKKKKGNTN